MSHKNILFIVADDLGKYLGCYGSTSVVTPSIDALASKGTKFDNAFASTASCSGSRSTIYTGLHTHENGQYGLSVYKTHFQTFPHIETAPALFNHAGYLTGIIGKIHVGPETVYPWTHRQESESRDVAWVADQCEAFFSKAKSDDKPFYLTVGFVDPHRDVRTRGRFGNEEVFDERVKHLQVSEDEVEVPPWLTDLPETRGELKEYYKAINRTDQGVGFILSALERQGLSDSTLVIFTSDNGPPFINAKTTLYDAGTCLPFIVRNPYVPESIGITNPNMVSFIDILPTLLDYAKIDPDSLRLKNKPVGGGVSIYAKGNQVSPPRRGRSFLPILDRADVAPESSWQHYVFGSHTFHELQNYWPTRVLRTRKWKYHRNIAWRLDFPFASDLYASYTFEGIRNNPDENGNAMIGSRSLKNYLFRPAEELFDLENDPDEVNNLSTSQDPEIRKILAGLRLTLEQWQQDTKDLWLFRDGASLSFLERYKDDGLQIPDRFDIDVEDPTVQGKQILGVSTKWDLKELP
ncbi:putative arylsulfatase [Naematelia encephala]|uniref:Putative arylsulfatase n=1 Tax=Naematelia encephala TaxID=71784 RepID=A0A1Y2B667_9TREE|nr:putative arylsulfatase [Naematelia encephala]